MERMEKIALSLWTLSTMIVTPFMPWWGKAVANWGLSFELGLVLCTIPIMVPMYAMLTFYLLLPALREKLGEGE